MNKQVLCVAAAVMLAAMGSTTASATAVVVTNSGTTPNTLPLTLISLGGGTFTGGSNDTFTSAGNATRNFALTYTFGAPTDGDGSISFTTTSIAPNSALLTITSAFFNGSPVTNLALTVGANGSKTYSGSFDFTNATAGDLFALLLNGTVRRGGTLATSLSFATQVPEPATWAMMVGGFGLIGATMRRRKSAVRTSVNFV